MDTTRRTKINLNEKGLWTALLVGWLMLLQVDWAIAGGGWVIYHDGSYQGKVIDAETKEPIEGAVVVAIYYESCFRFIQTNLKVAGAQEAVASSDGTFQLPSFWAISTPDCWYSYTDFIVFKPGHGNFPDHYTKIYSPENPRLDVYQDIFRAGVIVELPPLKTKEERLKSLHSVETVADPSFPKRFGNILKLIDEENRNMGFKK